MRIQFVFRGRVQGVGFRATARSIARSYPITGWVRNEPDGSVLLEAQGSQEKIDAFIAELLQAIGRNVESSSSMAASDVADEQGFIIRR